MPDAITTMLDAMQARCETEHPEPWEATDEGDIIGHTGSLVADYVPYGTDRVFIAHARADLPRALAALRVAVDGLRAVSTDAHMRYDHPDVGSGQYGIGVADGHRCAAKRAQTALAAIEAALKGEGHDQ